MKICSIENCELPIGKKGAKGKCSKHYNAGRYIPHPIIIIKNPCSVRDCTGVATAKALCSRCYSLKWSSNNQEKRKISHIKRRYGMTIEQFTILFELQHGCCKICKKHQSEFKKSLFIDHCHKTGAIRGLLCGPCNIAIGNLMDSPELALAAAKYLIDSERPLGT